MGFREGCINMVFLMNTSDTIGAGIWGLNSITGNWYVTLFMVFFLFVAVALIFRIPLEFVSILLLPLAVGFAVATSSFLPILVVILLFTGVLLAKNFFFGN